MGEDSPPPGREWLKSATGHLVKTKSIKSVESVDGETIKSLYDKICNFSDPNITAVEVILLDHAVEMLEWAADYCAVGDVRYSDSGSEVDEEVIAHYQAGQYLAKLVAGIK